MLRYKIEETGTLSLFKNYGIFEAPCPAKSGTKSGTGNTLVLLNRVPTGKFNRASYCSSKMNESLIEIHFERPDDIDEYYPRFGFQRALKYGIKSQWERIPDEAFMIIILNDSVMKRVSGIVRYGEEFDEAI